MIDKKQFDEFDYEEFVENVSRLYSKISEKNKSNNPIHMINIPKLRGMDSFLKRLLDEFPQNSIKCSGRFSEGFADGKYPYCCDIIIEDTEVFFSDASLFSSIQSFATSVGIAPKINGKVEIEIAVYDLMKDIKENDKRVFANKNLCVDVGETSKKVFCLCDSISQMDAAKLRVMDIACNLIDLASADFEGSVYIVDANLEDDEIIIGINCESQIINEIHHPLFRAADYAKSISLQWLNEDEMYIVITLPGVWK